MVIKGEPIREKKRIAVRVDLKGLNPARAAVMQAITDFKLVGHNIRGFDDYAPAYKRAFYLFKFWIATGLGFYYEFGSLEDVSDLQEKYVCEILRDGVEISEVVTAWTWFSYRSRCAHVGRGVFVNWTALLYSKEQASP